MAEIPPDVRSFIATYLDSVEALDLLLVIRRKGNAEWGAEDAAEASGLGTSVTEDLLAHFHARDLVEVLPEGRFRFRPTSDTLRGVVDRLADAHRSSRRSVLAEFIEPSAALSFSEAFRIRGRKKKNDG